MMEAQSETPGALAGATEGEIESSKLPEAIYLLRREWASVAWHALDECDPADAIHICATILAENETEGPEIPLFGVTLGGAQLWAECAAPHELAAYAVAALDRLKASPLGIATRKRVFVALWQGFPVIDRQAFLARVDAAGQFHGQVAA